MDTPDNTEDLLKEARLILTTGRDLDFSEIDRLVDNLRRECRQLEGEELPVPPDEEE